ncbi:MAG: ThiF family adenylyltransferase [Verrucomicrobiota bacterium]
MKLAKDQLLLPSLKSGSSIKVIGLGGVGSIVARYLSVFLASQKVDLRLVLIDGDEFEASNATRMLFGSHGNKASVICDELLPYLEDSHLALDSIEEYITPENLSQYIHRGDIIFLTVDNHATRKLINDYCTNELTDFCVFSGGNDGVESLPNGSVRRGTFGNAQIFARRDGTDLTPNLVRFHPEIANPGDKLPTDQNCTELVASVPQILFANLAVASAMLNTFFLHVCGSTHYSEVSFDIAEGLMRPIPLPK